MVKTWIINSSFQKDVMVGTSERLWLWVRGHVGYSFQSCPQQHVSKVPRTWCYCRHPGANSNALSSCSKRRHLLDCLSWPNCDETLHLCNAPVGSSSPAAQAPCSSARGAYPFIFVAFLFHVTTKGDTSVIVFEMNSHGMQVRCIVLFERGFYTRTKLYTIYFFWYCFLIKVGGGSELGRFISNWCKVLDHSSTDYRLEWGSSLSHNASQLSHPVVTTVGPLSLHSLKKINYTSQTFKLYMTILWLKV